MDRLRVGKLLSVRSRSGFNFRTNSRAAANKRMALSQSKNFNGKGSHMALGPWPVVNSIRRGRNNRFPWN
jgi:hypothetical protein